ncbi:MAG: DUF975 family protein [Oscillospiraceae bacterium]|nr:DUF975 family protein [Oscillospiraceae bacterium]
MSSRAELKSLAKDQIKGKIGILFLCMLIVAVISGAAGFTFVGPLILGPAFLIASVRIYLNLTDGGTPVLGDIFKGFDVIGKAVWLSILVGFFTMLWSMLLYVPGIIKGISYSMSFYILAENPDMTAREALNESKRIMKGNVGKMFVLALSFFPWLLLCGITFGIAGIYVVPYMTTTITNFYKEIR